MERREFMKLGLAGFGAMAFANNAWALKYYPMPSDKKWAVLYGTWCGSSRDAGIWISEGMGGIADVFDVRENPDLKGFDHIIIGGSIRMNVTSSELQEYIKENKEWLKNKVRGLFAICGNGENPVGPQQTTNFIDNHLAKLCEVRGVPSKVFLGRITKSLLEPSIVKGLEEMYQNRMGRALLDYDNLKRLDCMAFGKDIFASVEM